YIDADERSRCPVLHRGTQAVAKLRAIDEQVEQCQQDNAQQKGKDINIRHVEVENREGGINIRGMESDKVRCEDQILSTLYEQRNCIHHQNRKCGTVFLDSSEKCPLDSDA